MQERKSDEQEYQSPQHTRKTDVKFKFTNEKHFTYNIDIRTRAGNCEKLAVVGETDIVYAVSEKGLSSH